MTQRDFDDITKRITRERAAIIADVMERFVKPYCEKHKLDFISGNYGFYFVSTGTRDRSAATTKLQERLTLIEGELGCALDDYCQPETP